MMVKLSELFELLKHILSNIFPLNPHLSARSLTKKALIFYSGFCFVKSSFVQLSLRHTLDEH